MKPSLALGLFCAKWASAEYYPAYNETYVYLQDKYPVSKGKTRVLNREAVAAIHKKPSKLRSSASRSSLHRVPTDCTYPIEVVIVQDVTGSFNDDMPVMASSELPIMYNTLSETHPGSTFGVVSFADKPILPFGYPHEDGYRDDYCYLLDAPLGQNLTDLAGVYNNYLASGGADPPENQYGAIFNTIQAKKIGWGSNPDAIRLIVVSTDAPPHYDDDDSAVDRHGMAKFSGVFEEDNIDGQCTSQFYPSWQQTIAQINAPSDGSLPPYVAFLVYDSGADGKTLSTWEWVASQIHENDSFVRERAQDSSNFWEELSQIIGIMDEVECQGATSTTTAPSTTTTSTTTTSTTTTTTTTVTTKASTASTTASSTTARTSSTATTVSTTDGTGVPDGSTQTKTTAKTSTASSSTSRVSSESTATTKSPCPPCPCPGPHPCSCSDRCGNEALVRYPKDAKVIDVHIEA